MAHPEHPHDYHPDLKEDRLLTLAQFFADTRREIVALHEPIAGDDGWSLGCRSFARWRNLILKKWIAHEWEWLEIVNPGKKFIFSIGAVPVRFYRGSAEKPPARTLANSAQELTQLSLAFPVTSELYRDLKWRFAIETDNSGNPSAVIFAGLSVEENGSVVCHWKLPFDLPNMEIELDSIRRDDMIELPAPTVGKPSAKERDTFTHD